MVVEVRAAFDNGRNNVAPWVIVIRHLTGPRSSTPCYDSPVVPLGAASSATEVEDDVSRITPSQRFVKSMISLPTVHPDPPPQHLHFQHTDTVAERRVRRRRRSQWGISLVYVSTPSPSVCQMGGG